MRVEILMAALLLLADGSRAAQAEPNLGTRGPPRFSQGEQETIRHNDLLRAIVDRDPWIVRRVLDLMARDGGRAGTLPEGIDPAANPDLAASPRTAQGSVEWIDVLKAARDRKTEQTTPPVTRSAEDSVTLLDMFSEARAAKRREAEGAPGR